MRNEPPAGGSGTAVSPANRPRSADHFNHQERKLITGISYMMFIRWLGIAILIPVMSIIAAELPGSTLVLAGVALGVFGIAQIVFLIPIGWLSDRWGRKKVTIMGLTVYGVGMLLSGLSVSIHQLIVARVIAGSGAMQGVTMAWLTDGVREERRNAAMSYVGVSIGAALIIGFAVGPVITGILGTAWLFHICAIMTLGAIVVTTLFLKEHRVASELVMAPDLHIDGRFRTILKSPDMQRIVIISITSNILMSGVFFALPLMLKQHIPLASFWKINVPMAVLGTLCMFFFAKRADRIGIVPTVIIGCGFELAGLIAAFFEGMPWLTAAFILFYCGHCVLSPVLPAAVSFYPNSRNRGVVMSIFNTAQFIGSGLGSLLAGWLMDRSYVLLLAVMAVTLLAGTAAMAGYRRFRGSGSPPSGAASSL